MKINQLIIFLLLGLLTSGQALADEPFKMDLSYSLESGSLVIDLERVSRDEVKDFMQKLVVQKGEVAIAESMIDQNHLNEIKKIIPLSAEIGDEIVVKLAYGQQKVFEKSLIVAANDSADKEIERVHQEIKTGGEKVDAEFKKESSYGYSIEKEELGYKKDSSVVESGKYGYSINENPAYQSTTNSEFEEPDRKDSFGYKDPGKEDVGQKGFGYSDYGYEAPEKPFGRESYETPPLWNKKE